MKDTQILMTAAEEGYSIEYHHNTDTVWVRCHNFAVAVSKASIYVFNQSLETELGAEVGRTDSGWQSHVVLRPQPSDYHRITKAQEAFAAYAEGKEQN